MGDVDNLHSQWYSSGYDASWSGSARSESRSVTPLLSPQAPQTAIHEESTPLPPQTCTTQNENERLLKVEQVMSKYKGTDTASLRNLTTALAREAIFGREEMVKKSLSGRKNTEILDKEKLNNIKTLVRSRVPKISPVEFEHIWTLCRGSLSKSCQTLRNARKKHLPLL